MSCSSVTGIEKWNYTLSLCFVELTRIKVFFPRRTQLIFSAGSVCTADLASVSLSHITYQCTSDIEKETKYAEKKTLSKVLKLLNSTQTYFSTVKN